jgi:hypothetical protein
MAGLAQTLSARFVGNQQKRRGRRTGETAAVTARRARPPDRAHRREADWCGAHGTAAPAPARPRGNLSYGTGPRARPDNSNSYS